jgi:hypothetical protein
LPLLPLCAEALANTTVRFYEHSALKTLYGQFRKVCDLDYWDGAVLHVADGMIHVCMEYMHVYYFCSAQCADNAYDRPELRLVAFEPIAETLDTTNESLFDYRNKYL